MSQDGISSIRGVLEQVKTGKIDKSVAYNELKDILHQAVTKRSKDVVEAGVYLQEARGHDDVSEVDAKSDSSSIKFAKEERQMIINKLIEKKRMNRGSPEEPQVNSISGSKPNQSRRNNYSNEREEIEDNVSSVLGGSDNNQPIDVEWMSNSQYNHTPNKSSGRRNTGDLQRQRSTKRESARQYSDSFEDYGQTSLGRSNRILRTEAAIREEMFRECTFHPNVQPLPHELYGQPKYQGTPFLERVNKWQKEKDQQVQRLKNDVDRISVQDCSFHPVINRHSYKAMQELRAESSESVAERLYREAKTSVESKNKFLDDELRMQDEIRRQTCTFRPSLQTRGAYQSVGPKYALTPDKTHQKPHVITKEMKECTFTPKVKGIRPSMKSAQLYLSEDVVNRLSKPAAFGNSAPASSERRRSMDDSAISKTYEGGRVMDMASFLGGVSDVGESNNRGRSTSASRPTRARSHSAPRENRSRTGDESFNTTNRGSISVERKEQFETFILRQEFLVKQKKENIEQRSKQLTPKFQPSLCEKSKEISSRIASGEFLDRLDRDVLNRKEKLNKYEMTKDISLTFTPTINEKSKKMRPRSTMDMSLGDLLRKETSQRSKRLQLEQEADAELTFQPEISRRATSNGKSVIKSVTENSAQFMEWHKQKEKELELKRKAVEAKRLEETMKECTFTPVTRDCPSYIHRIAKSMEIVRAARMSSGLGASLPSKPEWR